MRKAIVCGGGVGGLSTAIALSRTGWDVELFEQGTSIREIGAGIFIKGNGLRVLESFGLLGRIQADCVVLKEAQVLDDKGRVLQRRILKEVNRVWNIKRELLIRALNDKAVEQGVQISLGHQATDFDRAGEVTIAGRQHKADLIVAADGVGSIARKVFDLGVDLRQPKSGAIRLLVPRTNFESQDMTREFWSSGLRVGVAPCTTTDVYSYLAAPLSDRQGATAPINASYWAKHFPKLADEGFFDRADIAKGIHHPYPYVRVKSWSAGNVALIGDSVHALPPTLGQGAGLTMMNAVLLSEYLREGVDIRRSLESWERDWRWVSNQTQQWALQYDRITSEWPRAAYPLRDLIIWAIGKSRAVNNHMRIADRIDAPNRRVLESADFRPSAHRA